MRSVNSYQKRGKYILKNRLNHIYHNMKQRCYNPKAKYYKHYGGRGITVCNEWLDMAIDSDISYCR